MQLLVVVTFAALVDPLAFEPQRGPYATADAACGNSERSENRGEDSVFCQRLGDWYVALRSPDGWFLSRLPLQIGVTPGRVTSDGAMQRVSFAQHAFDRDTDVDGEWLWLCRDGQCAAQAIPISIHDRSRGVQVDVTSQ